MEVSEGGFLWLVDSDSTRKDLTDELLTDGFNGFCGLLLCQILVLIWLQVVFILISCAV